MAPPIELEPDKILATIQQLERRIAERFAGSGLAGVTQQLSTVAGRAVVRAEQIRRPSLRLRLVSGVLLAAMGWLLWYAVTHARPPPGTFEAFDLVQAIEALLSALALLGVTVLFVTTLEGRAKRKKALAALHELRVLAHVIDMHQLAKDPERLHDDFAPTESSPAVPLTPFELDRYLNYCGDLLALVGKVAAYYLSSFQDEVVLAAVNEIEDLTNGLSRKVWQKLMLLDQLFPDGKRAPTGAPRQPPSER
ncbi:MAG: hypothetical protein FJ293_10455 [Planctomycetes bacterium]|nr:hypothetical protein [Planctomycetota bacterium]